MMENKDLPAFAHNDAWLASKIGRGVGEAEYFSKTEGLSKREYFAAMAMQGILSYPHRADTSGWEKDVAAEAISVADRLLKQLEQK